MLEINLDVRTHGLNQRPATSNLVKLGSVGNQSTAIEDLVDHTTIHSRILPDVESREMEAESANLVPHVGPTLGQAKHAYLVVEITHVRHLGILGFALETLLAPGTEEPVARV